MVYTMEWYVHGSCRGNGGNGQPATIAAVAAIEMLRGGRFWTHTKCLPEGDQYNLNPTQQRAEVAAIILALEKALERYGTLRSTPDIDLTIYSDSRHVVNCMNDLIYKWSNNGWMNAAGNPVANQDLIMRASDLDDEVRELGDVTYQWISRDNNQTAEEACIEELDTMADEDQQFSESSESSSDDEDDY